MVWTSRCGCVRSPHRVRVDSRRVPLRSTAISAKVIDGRRLARQVRAQYRERVMRLAARGVKPGLAVILVGDDPASRIYVANKERACAEVGLYSEMLHCAADVSEAQLLAHIARLDADPRIHGILVQLPLPAHIHLRRVLEAISPEKDVDGFNLYNVGGLVIGETVFPPCTPYGVQCLLESENIRIEGQNVIVVGASNIVGKPMAMMLMQKEATVAVCHAKTRDLAEFTKLADILVVAAGHPDLIKPAMVKEGAAVIDVGINRVPVEGGKSRLVGDVAFDEAVQVAGAITPVPGGVGPMTIACLLANTLMACCHRRGIPLPADRPT